MSGTVSKHVTLVSELSKIVTTNNLMQNSETEQMIASQDDHAEVLVKIKKLIRDNKVRNIDILRLICLYALRFEKLNNNEIQILKDLFHKRPGLNGYEIAVSEFQKYTDFIYKCFLFYGLTACI